MSALLIHSFDPTNRPVAALTSACSFVPTTRPVSLTCPPTPGLKHSVRPGNVQAIVLPEDTYAWDALHPRPLVAIKRGSHHPAELESSVVVGEHFRYAYNDLKVEYKQTSGENYERAVWRACDAFYEVLVGGSSGSVGNLVSRRRSNRSVMMGVAFTQFAVLYNDELSRSTKDHLDKDGHNNKISNINNCPKCENCRRRFL